jgi:hypothetical protein
MNALIAAGAGFLVGVAFAVCMISFMLRDSERSYEQAKRERDY